MLNGRGGESMRKLFAFLSAAICCLLLSSLFVYAENTVVSVGSIEGKVGDTVKVPVKISGNTGVSAFGFLFEYNNEYITPVSAENGVWDADIIFNPNYNKEINKAFATGAAMKNKTGDGEFIFINFKINKAIGNAGAEIKLNINQIKHLEGTVSSDIVCTAENGFIKTAGGSSESSETEIGFFNKSSVDNDVLTLPIAVKNNVGIANFGIAVNYDSNYVTPISAENGIWDSEIYFNPNYGKNQLFITGAAMKNKTGDGDFVYIKFKRVKEETAKFSIDIKMLKTAEEGAKTKDILYKITNGNISVSSSGEDIKADPIYDVNEDGNINVNDASLVLAYVLDKSNSKYNIGKLIDGNLIGDADGNGNITAADAALILVTSLNSLK